MSGVGRLGVLGGTFDPIHYGHLDAAHAARDALALAHVLLVPARLPPHKASRPRVSGYHRFAMAALALTVDGALRISDVELRSSDPSYTSVTLHQLALAGYDPKQLYFITGADAFAEITNWHDYPALLDRSHFVVVSRPGSSTDDLRRRLPDLASRMRLAGEGPPETDAGERTAIWLIDARTRDVSSSAVRHRIEHGEPTDDLLPSAVSAYIARHALYGAGSRG